MVPSTLKPVFNLNLPLGKLLDFDCHLCSGYSCCQVSVEVVGVNVQLVTEFLIRHLPLFQPINQKGSTLTVSGRIFWSAHHHSLILPFLTNFVNKY